MLTNGRKIVKTIDEIAPFSLAYEGDNVGFLIGNIDAKVEKILVALEVTDKVIDEAIAESVDMIVAHHPLIYKPLLRVTDDDPVSGMVIRLIKSGISLVAAHTNIDASRSGTAAYLAELLEVFNTSPLLEEVTLDGEAYSYGLIGNIEKKADLFELSNYITEKTGTGKMRLVKSNDRPIYKVAIVTGSGEDYIESAASQGASVLITGDIKYHMAMYALQRGISIIDMGHYESENIFIKRFTELLKDAFEAKNYDIRVLASSTDINPFIIRDNSI